LIAISTHLQTKGYELWSLKSRESELKRLWETESPNPSPFSDSDPATIRLDRDGKYAFILAGGRITKVGIADGKAEPAKFNALKELDGAAEPASMFEHIWRQISEKFYLKDMNGIDWDYYKTVKNSFHTFRAWDLSGDDQ